eukprot:7069696-Prymnesium_polylepis.1
MLWKWDAMAAGAVRSCQVWCCLLRCVVRCRTSYDTLDSSSGFPRMIDFPVSGGASPTALPLFCRRASKR